MAFIDDKEFDEIRANFLEANAKYAHANFHIKGEKLTFPYEEIKKILDESPGADIEVWHGKHKDKPEYTATIKAKGGSLKSQKPLCC